MKRLAIGILLVSFTISFLASTAGAVEFSVISDTVATVAIGETITIDIALSNASNDMVQGVEAQLSGLSGVADVVSGTSASWHFVQFCIPSQCFGGIQTVENIFFDPSDLSRTFTPGDDSVILVAALALTPTTANGTLDPGLDGAQDEPSIRDISITLRILSLGHHIFTIGGTFSDGLNSLPIDPVTVEVSILPEPTTALLLGLGLAALTGARPGRRGRR